MVNYDPKAWLRVMFSLNGTVLPRLLLRLVVLVGVALLLCMLDALLRLGDGSGLPILNPVAHTIMGVAIGLLIVFRNNCSYDRYWEGRRLWGSIVNSSRNLLRAATAYTGAAVDLANLVAGYALALKQHLRGNTDLAEVQALVPDDVFRKASAAANPPSLLAFFMSDWVHQRRVQGKLDENQARTLEALVSNIIDCQGGCERILRTPIPFAYAVHIKQLLWLFLMTLPFVLVPTMGWVTPIALATIGFGLLGIEEAGVEIEDPFGDDPNDLPIETMCATIARDTMALATVRG